MLDAKIPLILRNTFLSNTAKSMELAQSQIFFHQTRLAARMTDPMITPLYDDFTPLRTEFDTVYNQWQASADLRIGQTDDLEARFKQLSKSITIWNNRLTVLLEHNQMLYKQLMPYGVSPFQSGRQNDRVDALTQLHQKMAGHTVLDALRLEIENFCGQLCARYNEQKDSVGAVETLRLELEQKRIAASKAMWANLGYLNWRYPDEPERILFYFDFDELLKQEQRRFINTRLKPGSSDFIAKRSLQLDQVIELENNGPSDLWLYTGESKKSSPVDPYVIVPAGNRKNVQRTDLGDGAYFFVHNPSDQAQGNFYLEFK